MINIVQFLFTACMATIGIFIFCIKMIITLIRMLFALIQLLITFIAAKIVAFIGNYVLFYIILGYRIYIKKEKTINKQWKEVINTTALLTNNDQHLLTLLDIAKRDSDIFNTNPDLDTINNESLFIKALQSDFGEDAFDWLDQEPSKADLPCAVFKTLLNASGWVAFMDLYCLYHLDEMKMHTNLLLIKHALPKISSIEENNIKDKLALLNGDINLIGEVMFTEFENLIENRGRKILWFSESSDSFSFFIVPKKVYNILNNKSLDEQHSFKYE